MHQTVDTLFLKAASSRDPWPPAGSRSAATPTPRHVQSAPAWTSRSIRLAIVRGRRKDDATFIAIGGLLALYFLVQFGWVILHPHL
jgi:hypothetical protein